MILMIVSKQLSYYYKRLNRLVTSIFSCNIYINPKSTPLHKTGVKGCSKTKIAQPCKFA